MVKLDRIRPRVYVYETAGLGALAWLRSCWERVFFGHKSLFGNASRGQKRGTLGLYFVKNARLSAAKAVLFSSSSPQIAHFCCLALDSRTSSKQYELEDLGERGLAFRCTLEPRLFGPTTQQEEKALAAFKQAWEILRAGWAKVLGNLSAQERENAPRYFDFLQLKTILPIYAPDGRYIEAWQALYELSLPLAPAQDSLSRPPRVLLEGEYLSLELRGNYLAKAVFAHLPVQARRGSDLFAERFTQPTAMLFKRVNGRFLAPFFMGENGASPACKEAVAVGEMELPFAKDEMPIIVMIYEKKEALEPIGEFEWYLNGGKGTSYNKNEGDTGFCIFVRETVLVLNGIIKYKDFKSKTEINVIGFSSNPGVRFDPPTIHEVFKDLTSSNFLKKANKFSPVRIYRSFDKNQHLTGDIQFVADLTIWDIGEQNEGRDIVYVPPFVALYHEIGHLHVYLKYPEYQNELKTNEKLKVYFTFRMDNNPSKSQNDPRDKKSSPTYYKDHAEHDIVMEHYENALSGVAKVIVGSEAVQLFPRPKYSTQLIDARKGLHVFLHEFTNVYAESMIQFPAKQKDIDNLKKTRSGEKKSMELAFESKSSITWEPKEYIEFIHSVRGAVQLDQVELLKTINLIIKEWLDAKFFIIKDHLTPEYIYEMVSKDRELKAYTLYYKGGESERILATNKKN